DQLLSCIGGLDEDLGSTRISEAISVGRIEMEFPNDPKPVAGQQVESNPFVEGAIELLHGIPPQFDCPVCRHKRSAASAIWLKSSAPRSCPSPRAAIASRRSRETTSGHHAPTDRAPILRKTSRRACWTQIARRRDYFNQTFFNGIGQNPKQPISNRASGQRRFDFVVNPKTANALGRAIAPSI